jgi:hypothetical protein
MCQRATMQHGQPRRRDASNAALGACRLGAGRWRRGVCAVAGVADGGSRGIRARSTQDWRRPSRKPWPVPPQHTPLPVPRAGSDPGSHYMTQPLVELYGGCMVVLKVS